MTNTLKRRGYEWDLRGRRVYQNLRLKQSPEACKTAAEAEALSAWGGETAASGIRKWVLELRYVLPFFSEWKKKKGKGPPPTSRDSGKS